MLSREHGKQNLCWPTDGHCTKCVSSSRSWQSVHLSVAAAAAAAAAAADSDEVAADDDDDDVGAEMAPQSGSPPAVAAATAAAAACRDDFLCAAATDGGVAAGGDCRGGRPEVAATLLPVAESAGATPFLGDVGGTASATVSRAAMGPGGAPFCWAPPLSGDWAARLLSGDSELAVELGVLHTLG